MLSVQKVYMKLLGEMVVVQSRTQEFGNQQKLSLLQISQHLHMM